MKKIFVLVLISMLTISAAAAAEIRIGGHEVGSEDYVAAKGFGVGIILGEIDGLSIKSWVSHDDAFQFDINWDLYYAGLGVGVAYLIHNFEAIQADNNKFPLYFGIKGWGSVYGSNVAAGIQVPLGIAWIPRTAPIDIFAQIEPGIAVIPAMRFAPGGGVGIRYWFR
jgi:hypothetical protein